MKYTEQDKLEELIIHMKWMNRSDEDIANRLQKSTGELVSIEEVKEIVDRKAPNFLK